MTRKRPSKYSVSWPHFLHRKTERVADKSLCAICFKVKGLMRAQSEGRNWFCAWEIEIERELEVKKTDIARGNVTYCRAVRHC